MDVLHRKTKEDEGVCHNGEVQDEKASLRSNSTLTAKQNEETNRVIYVNNS